jgi:polar amino acid transport system permease protein
MIDFQGFADQLLLGAWMTVRVALGALAIGLVLGLLGATAKLSAWRSARALAGT